MSALPLKADITADLFECPLRAISDRMHRSKKRPLFIAVRMALRALADCFNETAYPR
jgi:hypothetical protein